MEIGGPLRGPFNNQGKRDGCLMNILVIEDIRNDKSLDIFYFLLFKNIYIFY